MARPKMSETRKDYRYLNEKITTCIDRQTKVEAIEVLDSYGIPVGMFIRNVLKNIAVTKEVPSGIMSKSQ
jgi:antitoxin component of RelBE/YafQ-DinJ toxin-antitoxin module